MLALLLRVGEGATVVVVTTVVSTGIVAAGRVESVEPSWA